MGPEPVFLPEILNGFFYGVRAVKFFYYAYLELVVLYLDFYVWAWHEVHLPKYVLSPAASMVKTIINPYRNTI